MNFLSTTSLIAHIYIDGSEVGTGLWSGVLSEGAHKVTLKLQKAGKSKQKEVKQEWLIQAPAKLTIPIDPKPFE